MRPGRSAHEKAPRAMRSAGQPRLRRTPLGIRRASSYLATAHAYASTPPGRLARPACLGCQPGRLGGRWSSAFARPAPEHRAGQRPKPNSTRRPSGIPGQTDSALPCRDGRPVAAAGDLPPGCLPLPASLRAQAGAAVADLRPWREANATPASPARTDAPADRDGRPPPRHSRANGQCRGCLKSPQTGRPRAYLESPPVPLATRVRRVAAHPFPGDFAGYLPVTPFSVGRSSNVNG
jgi:hypothetical protein